MAIELKVPEIGESITEVLINQWLVGEGDPIETDQPVAELESDKATVELPAPQSGTLSRILVAAGETTKVGAVIGEMEPGQRAAGHPAETGAAAAADEQRVSPAARRLLAEKNLSAADVAGSGKGGTILKEDVARTAASAAHSTEGGQLAAVPEQGDEREEILPLSPIRRTIARRLLESQQSTAQLTTFQEVDMSAVIELRRRYRDSFMEKHGIKLGFMSFFVKAVVEALKAFPSVNAEIRDDNIVYKKYYNIGIAVSGDKGLVVPVLKNAELLSFSELEVAIADFAGRGAENRIGLEELRGGTFTISNGGIFGSLMSTPILNPPQSGILGLHAIKERAVVVDGELAVRPMMYLALTYDHRIVDGRESVQFLIRIKEVIEDPARMLLEI